MRLARNDGGAIYEMDLVGGQQDTDGQPIPSAYVGRSMASIPELLGGWLTGSTDVEGNRCMQDRICGGDNLKYAENIRTLFIGEDTSRRNNNYVWAFNVDTRKLSPILSVHVDFGNTGAATAVFQVRSANPAQGPRTYTVEPLKELTDTWPVTGAGATEYDLAVHGPNGFFRAFKGGLGPPRAQVEVAVEYDEASQIIGLTITNRGTGPASVSVYNRCTRRKKSIVEVVEPGDAIARSWSLVRFHGWYDLTVSVSEDPDFRCQVAGHLETGRDSTSDPLMGGLV